MRNIPLAVAQFKNQLLLGLLRHHIKRFIVQAVACYDTPSQVVAAVKEEFGVTILRQQVQAYDPTKHSGRDLAKKWRDLFDATRAKFLDDASDIPIARQTYRLRQLQRLHEMAAQRNNPMLAAQLLEQAAKEVGGAYTDKRRIVGDGPGGAIPVEHSGKVSLLHTMSDDELLRIASAGSGGT